MGAWAPFLAPAEFASLALVEVEEVGCWRSCTSTNSATRSVNSAVTPNPPPACCRGGGWGGVAWEYNKPIQWLSEECVATRTALPILLIRILTCTFSMTHWICKCPRGVQSARETAGTKLQRVSPSVPLEQLAELPVPQMEDRQAQRERLIWKFQAVLTPFGKLWALDQRLSSLRRDVSLPGNRLRCRWPHIWKQCRDSLHHPGRKALLFCWP